jgi:hypothetical protein
VHGGAQGAQRLFEEAQATYDPSNIVAVLQHYPYHIDALLAMFELHRQAARLPPATPDLCGACCLLACTQTKYV